MNGSSGGLAGTIVRTSRIPRILVLSMFGLATVPYLPNFGMQGGKGGDFLSGFLKKYYPNLAWRKALIFIDKSEISSKCLKNVDISVV